MRPGPSTTRSASVGWRVFWGVMLVGHAPAWLTLGSDLAGPLSGAAAVRWILLTFSQVLFALKLIDVPWLRLPADRRALLAVTLVFALLHADYAARMLREDARVDAAGALALLVEGVALVGSIALVHTVYRVLTRTARRERCHMRDRWLAVRAWLTAADPPPRFLLLARACRVNRAPPA